MKKTGREISRSEALDLAGRIMVNAEKERNEVAVKEAGHVQFSIDAGTVFYDFLTALSGEMISSDLMYFVMAGMQERLLERGYKPEEVDKAVKVIADVLSHRRSKFTQDFMG